MDAFNFRMWPLGMDFGEGDLLDSLELAHPPRRRHLQPLPPLPLSLSPPPVTETHCVTNAEKRGIERLELNRNLLYSAEMQINKKCHKKLTKLSKKIAFRGLAMVGTCLGGLYMFNEETYFSLMICMSVSFVTDTLNAEMVCYFKLNRWRRHKSQMRTHRIASRIIAGVIRNELMEPYNGFLMSPSDATIEIHSARARVAQIDDTLLSEIEGSGANHTRFLLLAFVASLIYLAVIVSLAWFLRKVL